MSAPRKERRPLLIGLFASIVGSALVLPDPGLADTGKSPSKAAQKVIDADEQVNLL